jgi:RNA polymerase sigma factor (sigma-70 family)
MGPGVSHTICIASPTRGRTSRCGPRPGELTNALNRRRGTARTPHVTMGLVSRPPRSAEDSAADLELVRRVAAGDRGAVDDLYERFRRPAFALARRVIGDDVLAEDVLQEVFLGIWRDPAGFDGSRGSVASWLLAMVHHKAVDAVRREESHRRRRARAEDDLALNAPTQITDVEDAAWQRLVADRVRVALHALPAPQREALTLAYYGGYTQREVAALTDTPLGTVKTRMLAGMRRLKDTLGTGLPGTPADGTSR